jgi:hypothetical protein
LGRSPDLGDTVVMLLWEGGTFDFESMGHAVPLGWQSGDQQQTRTTPAEVPDARQVPLNRMSRDQRLAALLGEYQSTGTR